MNTSNVIGSIAGDKFAIEILTETFNCGEFQWRIVDPKKCDPNSLIISGELARRMFEILNLPENMQYRIICHDAALYCLGVIKEIPNYVARRPFEQIYRGRSFNFEGGPSEFPALVHYMQPELDITRLNDSCYKPDPYLVHSAILLARLPERSPARGQIICFEKKGVCPARFSTLDHSHRFYGESLKLVYVQ